MIISSRAEPTVLLCSLSATIGRVIGHHCCFLLAFVWWFRIPTKRLFMGWFVPGINSAGLRVLVLCFSKFTICRLPFVSTSRNTFGSFSSLSSFSNLQSRLHNTWYTSDLFLMKRSRSSFNSDIVEFLIPSDLVSVEICSGSPGRRSCALSTLVSWMTGNCCV